MNHHAGHGASSRNTGCCVLTKHVHPRRTATCAEQPRRPRQSYPASRGQDAVRDRSRSNDDDRARTLHRPPPSGQAGRLSPARRTRTPLSKSRPNVARQTEKDNLSTYKKYTSRIVQCKDLQSLLDLIVCIGPSFNYVNTASALNRLAWMLQRKAKHPVKLDFQAPSSTQSNAASRSNSSGASLTAAADNLAATRQSSLPGGLSLAAYMPASAPPLPNPYLPQQEEVESMPEVASLPAAAPETSAVLEKPKRAPPDSRSDRGPALVDSRRNLPAPAEKTEDESRVHGMIQEVRAELDDLQGAYSEVEGAAGTAPGTNVTPWTGPLLLPKQLRVPMHVLRDTASAELAATADAAAAAAADVAQLTDDESEADDSAAGLTEMDIGDEAGHSPEFPQASDMLSIGSRVTSDGLDPRDVWQLPGFMTLPDVPASQWPLLLRALDVLLRNVTRQIDDFRAWETCTVLWSLAKISYVDRRLVVQLLRRVCRQAASMRPEGVGLASWAIVSMRIYVQSNTYKLARIALMRLGRRAFRTADQMNPQTIANSAWALMTSKHASRQLFERFAERAYAVREDFTTQELSMWFMALTPFTEHGSAAQQHITMMEATAVKCARTLNMRDPVARNSIGRLLYTSTLIEAEESPLQAAILDRAHEIMRYELDSMIVPDMLYALATKRFYHSQLGPYLARCLIGNLRSDDLISRIEPSNWIYSLAKLSIPITPEDRKVVVAWATRFYRRFTGLGVKSTLHAYWGFCLKGTMSHELRLMFAHRIAKGIEHEQAKAERNYERLRQHQRQRATHLSRDYTIPDESLTMLLYAEIAYHLRPGRPSTQHAPMSHRALAELLERDSVMPVELREKVFMHVRRMCRRAAQARPSLLQQAVFNVLQEMGTKPVQEYLTEDGFYSIDIALFVRGGTRVAIEVDGPSHFAVNDREHVLGDTVARRRALVACGWVVISVPYYIWHTLKNKAAQAAWLQRMLVGAMRNSSRGAQAASEAAAAAARPAAAAETAGAMGAAKRPSRSSGGGAHAAAKAAAAGAAAAAERPRMRPPRGGRAAAGTGAGTRASAERRRRSQEGPGLQRPQWRWGQYIGEPGSGSE
eukprot:jgi/Ulvmu1/1002/UM103_0030.1